MQKKKKSITITLEIEENEVGMFSLKSMLYDYKKKKTEYIVSRIIKYRLDVVVNTALNNML